MSLFKFVYAITVNSYNHPSILQQISDTELLVLAICLERKRMVILDLVKP